MFELTVKGIHIQKSLIKVSQESTKMQYMCILITESYFVITVHGIARNMAVKSQLLCQNARLNQRQQLSPPMKKSTRSETESVTPKHICFICNSVRSNDERPYNEGDLRRYDTDPTECN